MYIYIYVHVYTYIIKEKVFLRYIKFTNQPTKNNFTKIGPIHMEKVFNPHLLGYKTCLDPKPV